MENIDFLTQFDILNFLIQSKDNFWMAKKLYKNYDLITVAKDFINKNIDDDKYKICCVLFEAFIMFKNNKDVNILEKQHLTKTGILYCYHNKQINIKIIVTVQEIIRLFDGDTFFDWLDKQLKK
jgi:hypothetical protein